MCCHEANQYILWWDIGVLEWDAETDVLEYATNMLEWDADVF